MGRIGEEGDVPASGFCRERPSGEPKEAPQEKEGLGEMGRGWAAGRESCEPQWEFSAGLWAGWPAEGADRSLQSCDWGRASAFLFTLPSLPRESTATWCVMYSVF